MSKTPSPNKPSYLKWLAGLWILLAALALGGCLSGCTGTVTPKIVVSKTASWDGTNQNSGFIAWAPDGQGIITPHARDRYNALVSVYGASFKPALNKDDGIKQTSTNTFVITQQALKNFGTMNEYRKSGKEASK